MNNLYPQNKGEVYPSPSSSSTPSRDAFSVLNHLPTAILALASLLTLEDREVLAYLITRSIMATNPSSMIEDKKKCKKPNSRKPPTFECGCFECYTCYWFRWDSSPSRELIHQAIEAFEEHLTNGELSINRGGKKKGKIGRRIIEKNPNKSKTPESIEPETEPKKACVVPDNDTLWVLVSDKVDDKEVNNEDFKGEVEYMTQNLPETGQGLVAVSKDFPVPYVQEFFNSRLRRIWSSTAVWRNFRAGNVQKRK